MPWLLPTDAVPESWPLRCVGCGRTHPEGLIKVYGERLKDRPGLAHVFERLCLRLPWCARCAQRSSRLLLGGLALLLVPWLVLAVASFEPSIGHLVTARTLATGAFGLNGLGLLLLGYRYWQRRPVRLQVDRRGVRGIVLRRRAVAEELARGNGLSLERRLLPRGW
jgi:DNA-directed RNA polymerase subunit N (RpoN/RPB10)